MNQISRTALALVSMAFGGAYAENVKEVKSHRIWDTRYFSTTATNATMFNIPIGGAWRDGTKSKNETNLYSSGQLPKGQDMIITHMSTALIVPSAIADNDTAHLARAFSNIMGSSYFTLKIKNKTAEFECPGSLFFPKPMFMVGPQVANGEDSVTVGRILGYGWYDFSPVPVPLGAEEHFYVNQTVGNPTAAVETILDESANLLKTQEATMQVTLRGVTVHSK